jgi:hypothetical protein
VNFRSISLAAFLTISLSTVTLAGPPEVSSDISAKYQGPWKTDFNIKVTKALSQYGARGCGIIVYRVSKDSKSEYLAACSTDNENWKGYMVWPNINEVMGPYRFE